MQQQTVHTEQHFNTLTPEQQSNIIDSKWVLRDMMEVQARNVAKGYVESSNQRVRRHLRQHTNILHTADIADNSTDSEMEQKVQQHSCMRLLQDTQSTSSHQP